MVLVLQLLEQVQALSFLSLLSVLSPFLVSFHLEQQQQARKLFLSRLPSLVSLVRLYVLLREYCLRLL